MKKYVGILILFFCLMIALPAVALVGQDGSPGFVESQGSSFARSDTGGSASSRQSSSKSAQNSSAANSSSSSSSSGKEKLSVNNLSYQIYDSQTGKVVRISPADYIKCVVAAEMPGEFHPEALKAQAVASHSYALRLMGENQKKPSSDHQGAALSTASGFMAYQSKEQLKAFYGDKFDVYWKKISDAVDSVINQVAVYQDQPIAAAYHSISGGKTETAKNVWGQDVAYLQPVDSPGDPLSPKYETDTTLSAKQVKDGLTKQIKDLSLPEDPAGWFGERKTSPSGTVTSITVGNASISGKDLRTLFSLRSANFTVTYQKEKDSFVFHTKGYGHGVGMSQYGADYLARQGQTYEQILKHYYQGIQLVDLNTLMP